MSSSVAAKKGSHCLDLVLEAQVSVCVCVGVWVCVCERECVSVRDSVCMCFCVCVCERQSVCEVWSSTSLYNSSLQFPQPQKGVIFLSTK